MQPSNWIHLSVPEDRKEIDPKALMAELGKGVNAIVVDPSKGLYGVVGFVRQEISVIELDELFKNGFVEVLAA
ncbi:MAG: hypothetical protein PHZ00_05845 [Candidatus Peribacteraceae bacterium]|nr:hypothetical protein [Candidatus Peribacteraceae bacterium]